MRDVGDGDEIARSGREADQGRVGRFGHDRERMRDLADRERLPPPHCQLVFPLYVWLRREEGKRTGFGPAKLILIA